MLEDLSAISGLKVGLALAIRSFALALRRRSGLPSDVEHIDILVEEPSMEEALRALLPKMVGGLSFEIYRHQGKEDLLARLPERFRGYAAWIPQTWRIVVVVDRDGDDCEELKERLETIARDSGFETRSSSKGKACIVINRIAIEELEAWYFGDWTAVRIAYPRVSEGVPRQAKFRASDEIKGGTWEALERVLQSAGYFVGGLRKIEAAREIAARMDPNRNRSSSFCSLRDALVELAPV